DPHSYARPAEAVTQPLNWNPRGNFETKTIAATATGDIESADNADSIIFDTKGLNIRQVYLDDGLPADSRLGQNDPVLGQRLSVAIPPQTKRVEIQYETSAGADALQWLSPQQTA